MLTQERLKERLRYDSESGLFRWLSTGKLAGTLRSDGRWNICVDGKCYRAHRLAWLYIHGRWPKGDIDHKHGIAAGNGIANLRETSRAVNMQNQRRARSDSKTGLLGVQIHGSGYRAEIKTLSGRKSLGTFKTPEEAHAVYLAAKRELHVGCTI